MRPCAHRCPGLPRSSRASLAPASAATEGRPQAGDAHSNAAGAVRRPFLPLTRAASGALYFKYGKRERKGTSPTLCGGEAQAGSPASPQGYPRASRGPGDLSSREAPLSRAAQ